MALDRLPIEIVHHTLGYLSGPFSGRVYSTGLNWSEQISRDQAKCELTAHPLYQLAAVSRHLNTAVEGFCKHLIIHDKGIGNFKILERFIDPPAGKTTRRRARRSRHEQTFRRVWVRWSARYCAFCDRRTDRRAIFNNNIRCCILCDMTCFPAKIVGGRLSRSGSGS